MERRIDAPDKTLLTIEEVASWLNLTVGAVESLVKAGRFPKGVQVSPKVYRWQWMDAVCFAHWSGRFPGEVLPGIGAAEEKSEK